MIEKELEMGIKSILLKQRKEYFPWHEQIFKDSWFCFESKARRIQNFENPLLGHFPRLTLCDLPFSSFLSHGDNWSETGGFVQIFIKVWSGGHKDVQTDSSAQPHVQSSEAFWEKSTHPLHYFFFNFLGGVRLEMGPDVHRSFSGRLEGF